MYIHIGGGVAIDEEDIIAILPKHTVKTSYDTRRCISAAIGQRTVTPVGDGEESYIICLRDEKLRVYSSPISSTALSNREM